MSPRRSVDSSGNALRNAFPVFIALVFLSAGGAAVLWASGIFNQQKQTISREGQIAFPALSRSVQAYDAIRREDLLNPQTRQLNVIWLPEAQANPKMLRDLTEIIGRVISRDKQAGFILTEKDFLPKGTRPGISAGIPPGKRSLTIPVEEIPGLELLRQGDQFDLLAVLPEKEQPISNIEQAALMGGIKPPDTRSGQLAKQSGSKSLVVGGTMIALSQGTKRSTDGAKGLVAPTTGNRNAKKPQMMAVIAIDPVEVAPLTEAIGLELNLYCVARSGHPEDTPAEQQAQSLEGLVPVVTLSRPITAYSRITQDDLADKVTGRLNLYYFKPDEIQPDWIVGFENLIGRVCATDLSQGAIIQATNLLPAGSPPGIAGAIPAGMESLTIKVSQLPGIETLKRGDRFEVHLHLPEGLAPTTSQPSTASVFGGRLSAEDAELQKELRSGIRVLSQSAILLNEMSEQDEETTEEQQVSIAVDSSEVIGVIQALHREMQLYAVGQGQGKADRNSPFPEAFHDGNKSVSRPRLQYASMEREQSSKGEFVSVPILVQDVKPRSRLTVEQFIDPSTGNIHYLQFSADQLQSEVMTDLRELIGKSAGRQLYKGEWVRQTDVCETAVWSVPCDIPADWSVIEVSEFDVRGLEVATIGDRIDLVSVRPVRALQLQAKAEWPFSKSASTFYQSNRDDIFTQADISTIVTHAMVVGQTGRKIHLPTRTVDEHVGNETQLGETINRQSITKHTNHSYYEVEATIWQIAVPLKSVPTLTQALAVQSIIEDGNGAGDNRQGEAEGGDARQPQEQNGNKHIDHEVAIYAVLRNPASQTPQEIPSRDIISEWMTTWGKRFSKYSKSFRQQAKDVHTIQQIRGNEVNQNHWLNGKPSSEFPVDAIHSNTIETQIDQRLSKGQK